ncbi:MAG: hypothetical protein UT65_C0033G0003 [Parcubacteria group bacterium GW2011_GWF2_39_8b]|nr:MAG: hypothetical protein UT65_C0033G0003 [Parcubacteria group bacterium GW2011_GWF2_39_8b]KKR45261.1 MAG: hypothetical protein UT81_C0018G0023 [Parcubacteria group bacterium GW2011_GWA2_40_14]OHA97812.1 MAG: hypothetical protein A3E32_00795 [Candidatus Zambryskibacteria bacterium RIFCSPHIGHO2_12_FULL_38_37]OHB08440.1 MAG: hypothetical protein A2W64_02375 [Candidatus Zambryskibacteria bacterium RIFCSPLOWO2_02_39_10]OHB10176.1 MAG: hypothetical protein A3I21_02325 [Candidatus Zambryskibacteri
MDDLRKQLLFLDHGRGGYLKDACLKASEVKVTTEVGYLGILESEPEPYLESSIIFLSNQQDYDLVILGHGEFGLKKAQLICGALRNKTIVVSDELLSSGIFRAYRNLGYYRFMTRADASMMVRRELKLE